MSHQEPKQQSEQTAAPRMMILVLCIVVVILAGVIAMLMLRPVMVVSSFEQCKQAGGVVLTVHPEQCMIGDTVFTNDKQLGTGSAYIGMTERDALAKAKQENTPARVVERDGVGLPITMDFAFGRHNLYIRDDTVYKVDVEGRAADR